MADSTQLNPGALGDVIVTEDTFADSGTGVAGQKLPVSKIRLGANGVDLGDVTPANPLPVGGLGQATGLSAPFAVDQSAGTNRMLVSDAELLSAVQETNRLLKAVVRGLSMQLDGYDLLQEER